MLKLTQSSPFPAAYDKLKQTLDNRALDLTRHLSYQLQQLDALEQMLMRHKVPKNRQVYLEYERLVRNVQSTFDQYGPGIHTPPGKHVSEIKEYPHLASRFKELYQGYKKIKHVYKTSPFTPLKRTWQNWSLRHAFGLS
jgi:hypothetical protein